MLNDYQLGKGMKRLLYSGKQHPPTLPEFVKLCRTVGHLDDVPDLPEDTLPKIGGPTMDRWQIAGNRRLLGHITRRIPAAANCYGRGITAEAVRKEAKHPEQPRDPHLDASPEFVRNINTFVAMKNRWVELMQAAATDDGVPPDEQNQCWHECMKQAEEIIAAEKQPA